MKKCLKRPMRPLLRTKNVLFCGLTKTRDELLVLLKDHPILEPASKEQWQLMSKMHRLGVESQQHYANRSDEIDFLCTNALTLPNKFL